ncbi:MAG: 23S rRNA (guanosine(2251)-2'-O)-methyltransferase RlmB [Treponema sp.]
MQIITGFHAIEEMLRSCGKGSAAEKQADGAGKSRFPFRILYTKQGPRVKKILAQAQKLSVPAVQCSEAELDALTKPLPEYVREHRGVVLVDDRPQEKDVKQSSDALFADLAARETAFVLVLDSITDPHNIGAIIRSADQFAADAVVLPERKSAGDFQTITKISAGAAAWVPLLYTANLVRTVEAFKKQGFWVFGADAQGEPLPDTAFPDKTVLIMGNEGAGIGRLLKNSCDSFTAIPTYGKLDSLNVSVAAGILMYEISKRRH